MSGGTLKDQNGKVHWDRPKPLMIREAWNTRMKIWFQHDDPDTLIFTCQKCQCVSSFTVLDLKVALAMRDEILGDMKSDEETATL